MTQRLRPLDRVRILQQQFGQPQARPRKFGSEANRKRILLAESNAFT
jgi:hypothetical protein